MPRAYIELPPPSPQDTLVWMRKFALAGQSDVGLRQLAEQIVREVWPRDYVSEYAAILNWTRRNVRYVRDPATIEQVQSPRATLEVRSGDCDDMAVFIACLIGHIGGTSRFVAGAFRRSQSGRPLLAHVWCEARDPASGAWVALDPVPGRRVSQMLGSTIDRIDYPGVG